MEHQILTIDVQCCHNCLSHAWLCQHNEQPYLSAYSRLLDTVKDRTLYYQVIKNRVPFYLVLDDQNGEMKTYKNRVTGESVVFPLVGSFEILINDILLFSKVTYERFPTVSNLQNLLSYFQQHHRLDPQLRLFDKYKIKVFQAGQNKSFIYPSRNVFMDMSQMKMKSVDKSIAPYVHYAQKQRRAVINKIYNVGKMPTKCKKDKSIRKNSNHSLMMKYREIVNGKSERFNKQLEETKRIYNEHSDKEQSKASKTTSKNVSQLYCPDYTTLPMLDPSKVEVRPVLAQIQNKTLNNVLNSNVLNLQIKPSKKKIEQNIRVSVNIRGMSPRSVLRETFPKIQKLSKSSYIHKNYVTQSDDRNITDLKSTNTLSISESQANRVDNADKRTSNLCVSLRSKISPEQRNSNMYNYALQAISRAKAGKKTNPVMEPVQHLKTKSSQRQNHAVNEQDTIILNKSIEKTSIKEENRQQKTVQKQIQMNNSDEHREVKEINREDTVKKAQEYTAQNHRVPETSTTEQPPSKQPIQEHAQQQPQKVTTQDAAKQQQPTQQNDQQPTKQQTSSQLKKEQSKQDAQTDNQQTQQLAQPPTKQPPKQQHQTPNIRQSTTTNTAQSTHPIQQKPISAEIPATQLPQSKVMTQQPIREQSLYHQPTLQQPINQNTDHPKQPVTNQTQHSPPSNKSDVKPQSTTNEVEICNKQPIIQTSDPPTVNQPKTNQNTRRKSSRNHKTPNDITHHKNQTITRAKIINKFSQIDHFDTPSYPQSLTNWLDQFIPQGPSFCKSTLKSLKQCWHHPYTIFSRGQPSLPKPTHKHHKTLYQTIQLIADIDFKIITDLFQQPTKTNTVYSIWLHNGQQFQPIIIDDKFLFVDNEPLYAPPIDAGIWLMILQKCLAKMVGGYQQLQTLSVAQMIKMITGCPMVMSHLDNSQRMISIMEATNVYQPGRYAYMTGREVSVVGGFNRNKQKIDSSKILIGNSEKTLQEAKRDYSTIFLIKLNSNYYNQQTIKPTKQACCIELTTNRVGQAFISLVNCQKIQLYQKIDDKRYSRVGTLHGDLHTFMELKLTGQYLMMLGPDNNTRYVSVASQNPTIMHKAIEMKETASGYENESISYVAQKVKPENPQRDITSSNSKRSRKPRMDKQFAAQPYHDD